MVTLEDAKEVAKRLVEEVSTQAVIAFGSVAREGEGNDLDLLIVTEGGGSEREVMNSLRSYFDHYAIDHFLVTRGRLTELYRLGSPFLTLIQKEGRVLYMKDALKEWVAQAVEELRQGRYLFQGGFYRGACFAAQQAVEKGIKAELLTRGWELERIHNIRRLIHIARGFGVSIQCEDADVSFLDSIYRGRYPAEEGLLPLSPPSAEDAARALSAAESVLKELQITKSDEKE
jgi:HEPN domain-containing protein/predicted nucleotidyltransferase